MAFAGFDKKGMRFFSELAEEMSREWFAENKARYEAEWVEPMTALLTDVRAKLAPVYRPVALGEPKILRIHRDVRFSKDKRPYKTNIAAVLTVEGKSVGEGGLAALYVHLGLDQQLAGAGLYQFDPERLARWRAAVDGKAGAALAKLVAALRADGYEIVGEDDLKKVPRGFDPDHPRAELLKMKGLKAMFPSIPKGLLHGAGFADWCLAHAKAAAPQVKWIHQHVG